MNDYKNYTLFDCVTRIYLPTQDVLYNISMQEGTEYVRIVVPGFPGLKLPKRLQIFDHRLATLVAFQRGVRQPISSCGLDLVQSVCEPARLMIVERRYDDGRVFEYMNLYDTNGCSSVLFSCTSYTRTRVEDYAVLQFQPLWCRKIFDRTDTGYQRFTVLALTDKENQIRISTTYGQHKSCIITLDERYQEIVEGDGVNVDS